MGMAFEVLCLTVMAVSLPNFLFRPQEVELWEHAHAARAPVETFSCQTFHSGHSPQ